MTGGWVVDGTGAPAYRADLAVNKGVVAAIGRLQHVEAAQRIDCTGLYLLPGFVDAHVHGDAAVFDPEVQLAALSQGVTTFVVGQDGLSFTQASLDLADDPARRFGLDGRRYLRLSMAADVVALNPIAGADIATYEKPRQPARGVIHVVINGVGVLCAAHFTQSTRGRELRRVA